MPEFPAVPRVVYHSNPLHEVICQLRFPPILRIEAEVPAQFQEEIRSVFPLLEEQRVLDIPPGLPGELAESLSRALSQRVNYAFLTEDRLWSLTLARDFIALSAKQYPRWEQFKGKLEPAVKVFISLYQPAYFSRVGLRYQNVVDRRVLGLDGVPWSSLLQPYVAGELADAGIASGILEAKRELLVSLVGPDRNVRVRHGLFVKPESDTVCYLIDSDFYVEQRTEVGDVAATLDYFNEQAGRLFRWGIQPRLHEALGPGPA
ncbi:MAG: TIGR04255 family protein [Candidatus Limnocylindrales bacterium]